ncbi:MAG: carbohydrate binding domain-containing protein [Planctomycetota bacterium]|nr:carbohydrate binding domain-containing protein [Planctomycetota bacterium]
MRSAWLVCLMVVALAVTAHSQENLVFNGDFEDQSAQNPPPGWAMWGDPQWKVAVNFTRDATVAHGGKTSFRIHHPKDTQGYIVTSPEHAIRPKEGMAYSVTFWAKASAPVRTSFGFTAYESIRPFRDAPSPGVWPIDVGTEWNRYSFEVHEGLEFFAPHSRYLLLTFRATSNPSEQVTLWVDDVAVVEKPNPNGVRLIDQSTLKSEPVQHRLKPGDRLEITLDAAKVVRPVHREVAGISFHRVAGWTGVPYDRQGNYTLGPELEGAIRELHLPMTRFYGVGHESFSVEQSIDKAAELCRRLGIPLEKVVLELEEQSANRKLDPAIWSRGVKHSLTKGYGLRRWEVGNEVYSQTFNSGSPMGQAFGTPDDYVAHVKAVSTAVKAVQPEAQIGLSIAMGNLKWGNYVIKQAASFYDFVCPHFYAVWQVQGRKFEVVSLTENFRVLEEAARLQTLVNAYNPGRDVYIYDTEWGMHSCGPGGERADNVVRNGNLWGTMHRAVRMIYYAREGSLRSASSWEMLTRANSPGFAILTRDTPAKRSMIYWLYYHFNRHLGESVLEMEGTAPYYTPAAGDDRFIRPGELAGPLTPAVATLSRDGKSVYLIVANASWDRPTPCRIRMRNFAAGQAKGLALSQRGPEESGWVDREEDVVRELAINLAEDELTMTLPARSIVFVSLRQ